MESNFGIYVHIPFCVSKCQYCSFVSKSASQEQIQSYINFLCHEIELKATFYKSKIVTSIYFGGGTPSFIHEKYIGSILNSIKSNFKIKKNIEISIECNPCSVTLEKLKIYKTMGINRLSFGVQSTSNKLLKILGRKHTFAMAQNCISMAKQVGFTNISCDLMIGIPNQTKQNLIDGVKKLASLGINHISAYMLMLETNTPLYNKVKSGELVVADDDKCVDMYNTLVKTLNNLGFNRYEISNFAIDNHECKHNINYWDMGEYVGFGVAAHSFVDGERFSNFEGFEDYYNSIQILQNKYIKERHQLNSDKHNKDIYLTYENLTKQEIIEETIMLGLRQAKGVNISKLMDNGYDMLKEKSNQISKLKEQNIIKIQNNHIMLNPKCFGVCSAVVLELI